MPDKTKYVVVVGTVMSGLGKGIFAGSLAKLIQAQGISVSPIKLEGYLNMDAGTLNPTRHGEVFVLEDGLEVDMDLGNYERMLNLDLTSKNFMTTGQVMTSVLKQERSGGYLGRDVQVVPHVTDEIKHRIRELAKESQADIVFIEIGGTVGDLENASYIEACRQLAYKESVCFVALTYVPSPQTLGEQKSKPAQMGLRQLMAMGVMPSIIAVRSHEKMSQTVKEKLSLFSGVPIGSIFGMHDVESAALVPSMICNAGLDKTISKMLQLELPDKPIVDEYAIALHKAKNSFGQVRIGIIGKYTALRDAYASVLHAIEHSAVDCGVSVLIKWVDAEDVNDSNVGDVLSDVDGVLIPGGFGLRGVDGKIACIRYAREKKKPFLGLCFGYQLAVIEFARNVCGLENATSAEMDSDAELKIVDILPDQSGQMGSTMRLGAYDIVIKPATLLASLFPMGDSICTQRFRHRYELMPKYVNTLKQAGMVFSGKRLRVPSVTKTLEPLEIEQVCELPVHPFYLATQGHPEMTSRPLNPDPLFLGFIKTACKNG